MEESNLKAKLRAEQELGKESAKKLRAAGYIPAVVYKGKRTTHIKISADEFHDVIHTKAGENVVVNLQVEESAKDKERTAAKTKKSSRTAVIKEIQYHPVKNDILHVDFNEISLTQTLTVKVPISVKGEAQGVKEGGVLEHILWEIEVECLPTQIPENIPVDATDLNIGDSILVKDLKVAPEIKILTVAEATVISLAAPHVEAEEAVTPEGEEIVEPEVIMERKPKEEEGPEEEAKGKEKGQE